MSFDDLNSHLLHSWETRTDELRHVHNILVCSCLKYVEIFFNQASFFILT